MVGVELLVGGWFTSAVIGGVVEKARDYFKANYELQKDTQEMVEELTDALLLCQATVTEAEKRTIINNPALANFLRRLRQAAYDAEDVLDNMEAQSIKEEVQGKNKVRKIASSSLSVVGNTIYPDNNLKSLKEIVDKMKKLSTQIPTIHNLVNMNINIESFTREVGNPRETISQPLDDVGLYGRENELNLILDTILRSESESSKKGEQNYRGILVIPIVGMGGVGKTALAQAVYNNPEVQQTFAKREWISVSNKPDVLLVMLKIFHSLCRLMRKITLGGVSKELSSIFRDHTLEDVSKELSSIIRGVKFIIVLDDMFESHWDVIYRILSHGAPGSVVLITTQNHVFANRVGTFGPIALTALDSGIFWKLFEHFALGNEVMSEEKSIILKSIGRKIADKLHGLPLAAKIIGKILRSKLDEDKWRIISESEWWNIPEGKSQILPSIGLGYEQLDPCLRQCFAYCSLFPRNSLIEKDRLVHMWIAQNFIQFDVNGVMRLEDIGRQWFDELVEKSFFQRAWDNNSYVMHELMHDLAVIVSSGECFFLREGVDKIPLGVRHLAVDTNNLEVIKGIKKHKHLRSFLYFGFCVKGMYKAINDALSTLDRIRVLDLSYMCGENYSKPPPAIWNLQNLRFLDLSSMGCQFLTHSSVDQFLYHLQALYIKKCRFPELPRGINKLINLRHLCAEEETIDKISSIGQLTNLQELDVFVVRNKEGHRITELRNLREIGGTLRINGIENIRNKDEAMLANLVDKKYLDSIYIYSSTNWRESNVDVEVLEGLQPHKDIKDLRIDSYVGSVFPNWIHIQIGDFLNLKTLYLISCVHVKVLPPLGELPSLKYLHMKGLSSVKFINYHLYGKKQTVFLLLEELVLKTLSNCEEWTDDARGREFFPRLSKLTIKYNNKLREAPLHLFSSSLKELIIVGCDSLREAPLNSFSSSLKELIIDNCHRLISLGNYVPCLCSLTLLKLCFSSVSVTIDPLNMPLLEDLNLNNCSELIIKGDLQSLTHLKRLRLVNCSKLFSKYSTKDQQKGKGLQVHRDEGLRSLTHLEADQSLWHHEYHLILGSLPSLPVLNLTNLKLTRFTNDQILWFQELTALKEIHFSNCEFEHLPASLTQLSSLKKMELKFCRKLKSLSDSMPPNLQELTLTDCSQNLVQLCQAYNGQDRQFISSIPVIHIDDTTKRHKGQIPDAHLKMCRMEIRKPSSDAIGIQACASCGKIFELSDFILHDFTIVIWTSIELARLGLTEDSLTINQSIFGDDKTQRHL